MRSMTLRLDDAEYQRLRMLAFVEDQTISGVVREAIREHLRRRAAREEFRASLQQAMEENAQLLADLAEL